MGYDPTSDDPNAPGQHFKAQCGTCWEITWHRELRLLEEDSVNFGRTVIARCTKCHRPNQGLRPPTEEGWRKLRANRAIRERDRSGAP